MPTESREVRLASRPHGEPAIDNFSFATVELRDPNPGEVLVHNVCISVDPYMRGRMNDAKSYVPPFQIGQPLEGGAVGRVIASQDERLPIGTYVQSMYGWREAFVASSGKSPNRRYDLGPSLRISWNSGRDWPDGMGRPKPRSTPENWRDNFCVWGCRRSRKRCLPVGENSGLQGDRQCRLGREGTLSPGRAQG